MSVLSKGWGSLQHIQGHKCSVERHKARFILFTKDDKFSRLPSVVSYFTAKTPKHVLGRLWLWYDSNRNEASFGQDLGLA